MEIQHILKSYGLARDHFVTARARELTVEFQN